MSFFLFTYLFICYIFDYKNIKMSKIKILVVPSDRTGVSYLDFYIF